MMSAVAGDQPPAYRSSNTTGITQSTAALGIGKPSGCAVGDILVVCANREMGGNTSNRWAAGDGFIDSSWTALLEGVYTINNRNDVAVFYKTAGASEPSSYTLNGDGGSRDSSAVMVCIQNGGTVSSFTSDDSRQGGVTCPTLSHTSDEVLLAGFGFEQSFTSTAPTNMTHVASGEDKYTTATAWDDSGSQSGTITFGGYGGPNRDCLSWSCKIVES